MLAKLLEPSQEESLSRLRVLLSDLRAEMVSFGATAEDEEEIRQAIIGLDSLFLLVVVGEFNSGKSSFINALVGEPVLEQGVTPTTTRIQVLRYGSAIERKTVDGIIDEVTAPLELLKELHIVDTPGTNAIERHHEAITRKYLPRADLVFFLTSADRPLTESERQFLSQIREWGKKVVIVLNKIDILESDADLERILAFIRDGVQRLLGFVPDIFPVATRPALQAKRSADAAALGRSRFDALENYLVSTLDQVERLRLKLLNPLGVALRLIEKYRSETAARGEVLKGDLDTIGQIERELEVYKQDMSKGFKLRLADVDNVLHEFDRRGNDFFEDTIRLSRVLDLMDKAKIKAEFERRVVADVPKQIDQRVHDVIDWLVASDLQQWQTVRDHLARRRSEQAERLVGQMSSGFQYDRSRLLDTVGKTAQRTLEDYDKESESGRMADSLQSAVAGVAVMGVGAVGLGAAVAVLASTAAADVTGILAAGAMAAMGLLILPRRKQVARKEFRERIGKLREQLNEALGGQFAKEVERSGRRVEEALAPYTRFVRAEQAKLDRTAGELQRIQNEMLGLRAALSSRTPASAANSV